MNLISRLPQRTTRPLGRVGRVIGTAAVIAAVMPLPGAVAAKVAVTPTAAAPPPVVVPSVWLSPTGNDATCVRRNPGRPCATFSRAYQIAASGDVVAVSGGTYAMTEPNAGATTILPDPTKTDRVTFACQGNGDVTFAARNFTFFPGTTNVTVRGSCFRFHVVRIGYGGYPARTQGIVLDGVHMDSFECAGCSDLTISKSEIGPLTACYAPGTAGNGPNGYPVPQSAWCDPNDPVQAYWATQPNGTVNEQSEPYIHNGAAGLPTNIKLISNHVHGLQTKDPANIHTGGLLIWNVDGLLLRGNVFDHNAVYDIESNDGDVENNVVIERNTFGWPVYPLDPRQPVPGGETKKDWRELTLGHRTANYANWVIRYNTFAHGMTAEGTWTNAKVVGNVLGSYSTCGAGLAYDHNVGVAGGSACGGLQVRVFPYTDYGGIDFRLVTKSRALRYLAGVLPTELVPKELRAAKPKPTLKKPKKKK
ncbi:MAG TPA: hypothetical protein VFA56_08065 [Gaiellaceae bacterium]|nr:hypothetical protein [Gaiellaceae bacterium]